MWPYAFEHHEIIYLAAGPPLEVRRDPSGDPHQHSIIAARVRRVRIGSAAGEDQRQTNQQKNGWTPHPPSRIFMML
jgi:hypothetical protein